MKSPCKPLKPVCVCVCVCVWGGGGGGTLKCLKQYEEHQNTDYGNVWQYLLFE